MTTAISFSRQNDAGLSAHTTLLWENFVLVVVLVLESKALYLGPTATTTFKFCASHLFSLRLILVSVVFLPRACPMAAAPTDRILLSQRFRVVKLHRPFNSLPTALAPLSLILLCERSEKRSNELWLKLNEGSLIGFSESRVCVIWSPGFGI